MIKSIYNKLYIITIEYLLVIFFLIFHCIYQITIILHCKKFSGWGNESILNFVLLVNNVYTLTVLEDENKILEIYGNFLLYTGYGHGQAPAGVDLEAGNNTSDSMLYGVQDNSNAGLSLQMKVMF